MTDKPVEMTVQIKYKGMDQSFLGNAEDVWHCVNKFFREFVPSFEIARNLVLNIDLEKLANEVKDLIAFSSEGPNVLVERTKLTDNETLLLWLLACRLGYEFGLLKEDAVAKDDFQLKLSKNAKILSTRLGELVKSGMTAKTSDEKYRMTTFGVMQMRNSVIPRIRSKLNVQGLIA